MKSLNNPGMSSSAFRRLVWDHYNSKVSVDTRRLAIEKLGIPSSFTLRMLVLTYGLQDHVAEIINSEGIKNNQHF